MTEGVQIAISADWLFIDDAQPIQKGYVIFFAFDWSKFVNKK